MTEPYSITFETKCYENDWEFILKGNYLKKIIERCGITLTFRQLIINNVKNRELVEKYAKQKIEEGIIDTYYFAEDTEKEVLSFFGLSKEELGKGFVYSISELTGIYKCQTEYLLHFASDAFLTRKAQKSDWIKKAIELMKNNKRFIIANPTWDSLYKQAKNESFDFIEDFGISKGCSDQCYLIKVANFKEPIYNYTHPDSERYPKYGGELFEKRVNSFLRNTDFCRLNYLKATYIHGNFPKAFLPRCIYKFLSQKFGWTFTLIGRNPGYLIRIIKKLKLYGRL